MRGHGDYNTATQNAVTRAQALSKCAHAVIVVVKANDPRLKDGKYEEILLKIRQHFRENGKIAFFAVIQPKFHRIF